MKTSSYVKLSLFIGGATVLISGICSALSIDFPVHVPAWLFKTYVYFGVWCLGADLVAAWYYRRGDRYKPVMMFPYVFETYSLVAVVVLGPLLRSLQLLIQYDLDRLKRAEQYD